MRALCLGVLIIVAALAARPAISANTVLGGSCDLAIAGGGDVRGFLAFDAEFRSALMRQDAAAMAFLVRFPLHVYHPGGYSTSLDEPAALQALFNETFPSVVREVILKQKPESIFCKSAGIMYGSGEVWVEPTQQGKAIRYQVTSVSASVVGTESEKFRTRRITFICDAEKHRVIVDQTSNTTARYRAWDKPRSIADPSDLEIPAGQIELEGTSPCGHTFWNFRKGNTRYVVSDLGCTDGREPRGAVGNLEIYSNSNLLQRWWCY